MSAPVLILTGTMPESDDVALRFRTTIRAVSMTTDPSGQPAGSVYFNSTTKTFRVLNGTTWTDA